MAPKLSYMKGKELIKKILPPYEERDFKRVNLEPGIDLRDYEKFGEMQEYLKTQDLRDNPINIIDSDWRYITAVGLYFPHIRIIGSDLSHSEFLYSQLQHALIRDTKLRFTNLDCVNLEFANFSNVDLYNTNLRGANLRHVGDLEKILQLDAIFLGTIVSPNEIQKIETYEQRKKKAGLFIVQS